MALTSVFWSIAGNLAIDIGRISRALKFPTYGAVVLPHLRLFNSTWWVSHVNSPLLMILSQHIQNRLSRVSLIFLLFSVDSKTDRRSTHSETWLHLLLLQRIHHKSILFFPYSLRLVTLPRVCSWSTFIYRTTERPCGELSLSALVLHPQLASSALHGCLTSTLVLSIADSFEFVNYFFKFIKKEAPLRGMFLRVYSCSLYFRLEKPTHAMVVPPL